MRSGTAVSWLEPALNGEVLRVHHTCTTSGVQIVDRADGSRVECVTLAAGRFVPVSQLVVGHEVKPPKKTPVPAGVKAKQNEQRENDSATAAAVARSKVPRDRDPVQAIAAASPETDAISDALARTVHAAPFIDIACSTIRAPMKYPQRSGTT